MRGRAAVFAVACALAACSSGGGGSAAKPETTTTAPKLTTAGADGTVEVVVVDNHFVPERVVVRAGTTVRWRNQGFSPHRIVPSVADQDFHGAGGVPFGVTADEFRERENYRFTFTTPGSYPYYCSIHGLPYTRMHGRVVVVVPKPS